MLDNILSLMILIAAYVLYTQYEWTLTQVILLIIFGPGLIKLLFWYVGGSSKKQVKKQRNKKREE